MCRSPSLSSLAPLALVAVTAFAVGCGGEHAAMPRPVDALTNRGGSGGGMGGDAGLGGAQAGGTSGAAPAGTGGLAGTPVAHGGQGGATAGKGGGGPAGMGGGGGRPTGSTPTGSDCTMHSQCMTGYCVDGVCCVGDCTGICRTCKGKTPGQCVLADDNTDPRNNCAEQTPQSCGTVGTCTATGTCKMYDKTTVCDPSPSCDATSSGVMQNRVCDGGGHCNAGTVASCNGFLCSSATCGTICGADNACVAGGFCSAAKCVAVSNVVANGDLETGTLTGWAPANGIGTLALSSATVPGDVHGGQYSLYDSGRNAKFSGPGYNLPTGLGIYKVSLWAMQKDDPIVTGVLQIRLDCPDNAGTSGSYVTVQDGGGFGIPMPQGVWTQFSATVDTSDKKWPTPLCYPTGPGLVKGATLYLNQIEDPADGPVAYPTLYVDDVVVTVPDGHNLIGNPNFDAGLTSGWASTTGKLGVSTTAFHTGTRSLSLTMRPGASAGFKYQLPTGPARYTVTFWAMQTGTMGHQLQLQPSYTCIPASGGTAVTLNAAPSTPVQADPNAWVQVTQTFVMPPVDAPAGCVLSQASVTLQQADTGGTCAGGECPDLYLDDASLVIPVQ
jgi:hypothetical protein